MNEDYEIVYTVTDFWDGPRRGVADYQGVPHFYESVFDEEADEWSDSFRLAPIDEYIFGLVIEDWEIWKRWKQAWREGKAPPDSHPTLPRDKARHAQIAPILASLLLINPETALRTKAQFKRGQEGEPIAVRWLEMAE